MLSLVIHLFISLRWDTESRSSILSQTEVILALTVVYVKGNVTEFYNETWEFMTLLIVGIIITDKLLKNKEILFNKAQYFWQNINQSFK